MGGNNDEEDVEESRQPYDACLSNDRRTHFRTSIAEFTRVAHVLLEAEGVGHEERDKDGSLFCKDGNKGGTGKLAEGSLGRDPLVPALLGRV